jgi:ATP-dependent Lon protease
MTLSVGRPRSLALVRALHVGDVLAVATQRDAKQLEPSFDDLYPVGTFARVVQITRQSEGYRLTLEGIDRVQLDRLEGQDPFWKAHGEPYAERGADSEEARLLAEGLLARVAEWAKSSGGSLEGLPSSREPSFVADRVAGGLFLETHQAMEVLETQEVAARLRRVMDLVSEAKTRADLRSRIEREVREQFGKAQRDAILREQLKAIRHELGEDDASEQDSLSKKLRALDLPEEVRKIADRELKRLEGNAGQGPEAGVIRNYLDWISELPWSKRAETKDDLEGIAAQLDADHTGLDQVKKRILEQLAVHKLSGNARGTILCFVGPPGVGKTSLGQSIATATGRPFVRISLGGVRDEAEIRGHRRTYIGALPGRILNALRKAGVKNPVMLLDEIDKLGSGWAGSPEAALLEVLDPEQNRTFTDHYLETPFDLSEVMFLCTANTLETVSPPLRDRLEIVELSGYTQPEKLAIARKHLIPRRAGESGVGADALALTDGALDTIIQNYTREAGVRQLDREITRLLRSMALEVARHHDAAPLHVQIDTDDLVKYLGKPRFHSDVAERTAFAGVATGLAWTPFGGDILFVETSRMPGKGRLEITGQLGDVMKESARAALSFVRSHAAELGVEPSALDATDLHIHVPAGAVPKDGPSAGVTIFTALVSLLSARRVRPDTAMTGECTLRGRVLPVGGIKAKVLAAHRAGIRRVVLPENNRRDLDEVPEATRDQMEFIFASDMTQVLAAALEPREGDVPDLGGVKGARPSKPIAEATLGVV